MAMTFRAFCDLADWSEATEIQGSSGNTAVQNERADFADFERRKSKVPKTDMNLHYNIQIHLPETTNMAVYDAIFQSLKKHLL